MEAGGLVVPFWCVGTACAALVALAVALWALELAARAPFSLKDCLVIVTGAGGDIGGEISRLAAEKGAWVATWDSSARRLASTLTASPALADRVLHSSVFDITDDRARQDALHEALARYADRSADAQRVVVVNNAGQS